jgi:hypothetical protein
MPLHGSAFDCSVFPKYIDAIMNESYAYPNKLLGNEMKKNLKVMNYSARLAQR